LLIACSFLCLHPLLEVYMNNLHNKKTAKKSMLGNTPQRSLKSARFAEEWIANESIFSKVIENGPLGMAIFSLDDGHFIRVNKSYCAMLGYAKKELLALHISDVTHPDHRTEDISTIAGLKSDKIKTHTSEKRYINKKGALVWVSRSLSKIVNPNDKSVVILDLIEDISQKKQAEVLLIQSERRLKESQAITHIGTWEINLKDSSVWASTEAFNIYGLERKSPFLTVKRIQKEPLPEYRPLMDAALKALIQDQKPYDIEFRIKRVNDGEERVIHSLAELALDENGKPIKVMGTIQDVTERKQTEDRLRDNEARFRAIFEQAAVGVAQLDTKTGHYLRINHKYCDLLGYSREEMLTKTFMDVTFPDDIKKNLENNLLLMAGKTESFSLEKRFMRKNGSIIWMLLTASPMWKPGEKPDHFTHIAIVEDITDRKQAEDALAESESRFKMLFEQAPLGYQSLDFDGKFIEVNQTWLDILGYSKNEVVGHWFGEFLAPEYVEAFRERFPLFKAAGQIHSEFEMVRKDGTHRFISFEGQIGKGPEGQFIQTHCILDDITERKRAEQALRESEDKFKYFFNHALVGMSLTNPKGPLKTNQAFCDLLGYSSEELNKKTWQEITHPEDINITQKEIDRLLAKEVDCIRLVKRFLRKDGSIIWVDLSTSARWDDQGNPLYMMTTLFDITERKLAVEELKEKGRTNSDLLFKLNEAQKLTKLGSWDWDLNTNKVWWSDETYLIFGVSKNDYLPSFEANGNFIHPEDLKKYQESFAHSLQTGKFLSMEIRIISGDGKIKFCHAAGKVKFSDTGKPQNFTGTIMDISEQKKAEEAEKDNEARFFSIFNGVKDAILVESYSGQIWDVNQAACDMFGYSRQDFLTKTVKDLVSSPKEIVQYNPKHPAELPDRPIEAVNVRATGEHFPIELSVKPQKWKGDEALFIVGRDISERKRIEEEVRKRNEDLALLNEINNAANHNKSIVTIANLVSEKTKGMFNSLGSTLYLVDRERNHLVMQNHVIPSELKQKIEKVIGISIPPFRHNLNADHPYQQVFLNKKPILITDLKGIQEFIEGFINTQDSPEKNRARIAKLAPTIMKLITLRSLMVVPLISNEEIIGTLDVAGTEPYTEDDLARLENITNQLTIVITRMQSETKVTEKMDELSRWYEATLGRETRILNLKSEVNELLEKSGQPPRYANAKESSLQ
jgi:PAS domain S-box-containing protein